MTGRLASHRFRRRLAWTVGIVGALAAIVVGAVLVGNTGKSDQTPLSNRPTWTYREPTAHRLTQQERIELFTTSTHFIRTAVARRQLDEAWALLGPEMRAGQTRKEWDTGTNNVVPFPVAGIATWDVLYSYEDDVALNFALISKPGYDIVGKTFTIELKRYRGHGSQWLVASWVPNGVSGAGQSKSAAAAAQSDAGPRAPLSAAWLLVPLSILALIVLVPIALAIRSFFVHRRASKRYAQELATYRSTSRPS
jgi:hypothetical protein